MTKEHFYHFGGSQSNRNSMLEALILNHKPPKIKEKKAIKEQSSFEDLLFMPTFSSPHSCGNTYESNKIIGTQ